MIVFKAFVGGSDTSNSVRSLLGRGDLVPSDSWSEVSLTYEKYEMEDLKRSWEKIVKSKEGLPALDKVPSDGTWGLLYED